MKTSQFPLRRSWRIIMENITAIQMIMKMIESEKKEDTTDEDEKDDYNPLDEYPGDSNLSDEEEESIQLPLESMFSDDEEEQQDDDVDDPEY
ncbi:hypothetical protein FRX31_034883 [Thalictrum thalictroides]|uniref:Uncharacterized protein n=1 Tax=Thalictrum thalictroides TaxID=46969 RepID=A0A7J6UTE8_THATH|nr:hypothetical protein FRX31_034883 [Thalictrum thalictroides]